MYERRNFTMPSYGTFFTEVFGTLYKTWLKLSDEHKTPRGWILTLKTSCFLTMNEVYTFLALALFWTLLRYFISWSILKPIVSVSNLPRNEANKAPESAWKLFFYSCTWSYSVYLLFFTKYNFFYDAPSTFYGWKLGMDVPFDITVAYMVQMSFYLHSVYGTLFMDVWRKDSVVMLFHHLITMLLVGFSYAFRYVNIGILILFCHDITDIVLESTKLVLYYKTKGGLWHSICDFLSTVGFLLFGTTWYVFRLYWFPLKAMYAAGHTSIVSVENNPPFYFFFNILLWVLLGLNVYWFMFIVLMAYKVVTGQASEVEDIREDDNPGEIKKQNNSNGVHKNGVGQMKNGVRKSRKIE